MRATRQQREEGERATERARASLKIGDRIKVSRCAGLVRNYIVDGWIGCWIVSKTGVSDIHALHVLAVNRVPTTFRDTIEIDRKVYERFVRYPREVTDGTFRCIQCGQIDDEPWHDHQICCDALEMDDPADRQGPRA